MEVLAMSVYLQLSWVLYLKLKASVLFKVWEASHSLRITALTVRPHNEFSENLELNLLTNLRTKINLKCRFFKNLNALGLIFYLFL